MELRTVFREHPAPVLQPEHPWEGHYAALLRDAREMKTESIHRATAYSKDHLRQTEGGGLVRGCALCADSCRLCLFNRRALRPELLRLYSARKKVLKSIYRKCVRKV